MLRLVREAELSDGPIAMRGMGATLYDSGGRPAVSPPPPPRGIALRVPFAHTCSESAATGAMNARTARWKIARRIRYFHRMT